MYIEETISTQIIDFLSARGFDNVLALSEIDMDDIAHMENQMKRSLLQGEKKIIIALEKKAREYDESLRKTEKSSDFDLSSVTFILKELVKSAMQNANVPPNRNRYSEAIQWFSTYIFLLSGKAAYEFISSNLMLPSISTISVYLFYFKVQIVVHFD